MSDAQQASLPAGDQVRGCVTVTHRGWSALRADHPVRHRLEVAAFCRMTGLWWGEQMSSLRELVS